MRNSGKLIINSTRFLISSSPRPPGQSTSACSTKTNQPIIRSVRFLSTSQRSKDDGYPRDGGDGLDTSTWEASVNRRWTPMTIVMIFVPILTFGLGTWQVNRLKWKTDLIDDLEQKMSIDPISLPRKINLDVIPEFEYRKVKVKGRFDHSREILIESRTRESEIGYHLITPFYRQLGDVRSENGVGEDQEPILVNRGFIKKQFKDPSTRPLSRSDEKVEIVGMIRKQESKSIFQPENNKTLNQWYFIDIDQISNHLNCSPILIDAITVANSGKLNEMLSNGLPIGRSPTISIRNMHLSYIFTWYGLSAVTSFMAISLLRRPMTGKSKFAGIQ
ncbi:SURF-family protein [Phakopsora pachyrhizi]|uniref:SURF1-like protein n=1 Tax=Phakopsora pachyrhizi TaxID=170000 RepID=A0AAV0BDW2_PHAPC|nr:SURF-family protein [Phakopsora pachyrhizi]CAH7684661.1 SURF-family protein [Phakopsora pachyrhizi]